MADLRHRNGVAALRGRLAEWRRDPRLFLFVEIVTLAVLLGMTLLTYLVIAGQEQPNKLLSPPVVSLLLVANLVPAIALLVLLGRRVAKRRAAQSPIGGDGRLHVRLVAIFSIIASVPMLLVVIFASLLFQYGVQFWFSSNARAMLQNASDLARGYYEQNKTDLGNETITMASDLRDYLRQAPVNSQQFQEGYIFQVVTRKLNGSAIVEIGKDGVARTAAVVNPDGLDSGNLVGGDVIQKLAQGASVVVNTKADRLEAVTLLEPDSKVYLYASRNSGMLALSQMKRARAVLADYDDFTQRSRSLQLQFNAALILCSLLLVGIAVWIALAVADRLVRPVAELVDTARKITAGDLSARVPGPHTRDEVGTLASAFNRMTQRLEAQTRALVSANSQLDNRRMFIEAVLSGVTAGVLSVDQNGMVQLANSSAEAILRHDGGDVVGRPLDALSPDLAELLQDNENAAIVQVKSNGDMRTLAVKVVKDASGHVLTFDDITQQLTDQRRAAWSDVARRIAHEIKNPLTPIQLAAERLQRRYSREVSNDRSTFDRLTGTIVRQVGDLRRIVDEFSSFARMPKPVFRAEAIGDIARHSLFLHEVAHPEIGFAFQSGIDGKEVVCDRRQIGQALTNIVKNAVEAIEQKYENGERGGQVTMRLDEGEGGRLVIEVRDNGVGLPAERERIIEPYMTTRQKGTGLGLAIVKKIVEEHFGEIAFDDAPGGGARVRIILDPHILARLDQDLTENRADERVVTTDGA